MSTLLLLLTRRAKHLPPKTSPCLAFNILIGILGLSLGYLSVTSTVAWATSDSCLSGSVWTIDRCTTEADRTCKTGFVFVGSRGCVLEKPNICGQADYAMVGGRCQDDDQSCPAGQVWRNDSCQSRGEEACPAGQELVDDACRLITDRICISGYVWSDSAGRCVASCSSGSFWFEGSCKTADDLTCPSGQVYVMYRGCVLEKPNMCGKSGWVMVGGRCQPKDRNCAPNEVWQDGECVVRDEGPPCKAGYALQADGTCQKIIPDPVCSPGYEWDNASNRCVIKDNDDEDDDDGDDGDDDNGGDNGGSPPPQPPSGGPPPPQQTALSPSTADGSASTQTRISLRLRVKRPVDRWSLDEPVDTQSIDDPSAIFTQGIFTQTAEESPTTWYLMHGLRSITVEARWKPDDVRNAKPKRTLTVKYFAADAGNDCTKDEDPCVCQTTPFTEEELQKDIDLGDLVVPAKPANNPGQWEYFVVLRYNDVAAGTCNAADPRVPDKLSSGKMSTSQIQIQ